MSQATGTHRISNKAIQKATLRCILKKNCGILFPVLSLRISRLYSVLRLPRKSIPTVPTLHCAMFENRKRYCFSAHANYWQDNIAELELSDAQGNLPVNILLR